MTTKNEASTIPAVKPILTAVGAVDPWSMQRALMAASDQKLPKAPELNKEVMLYARLNLEEGAETFDGLHKALHRIVSNKELAAGMEDKVHGALASLAVEVQDIFRAMKAASLRMEHLVARLPNDFRADLTREEVIEMADGTTDLTVTNSGFACALGVDGAACYLDVAGSNLSKANPDDGKIHKMPDGKWIKDPRTYRAPSLAKVIYGEE